MALPTVTTVAPLGGPAAGGTVVTLTGTNFTGAKGVRFSVGALSPLNYGVKTVNGPGAASEAAIISAGEGFFVESGTTIKVIAPANTVEGGVKLSQSGGLAMVSVCSENGEWSSTVVSASAPILTKANAEKETYLYEGAQSVVTTAGHTVETVNLGHAAETVATVTAAATFREVGSGATLGIPLLSQYNDTDYFDLSVDVASVTASSEVTFQLQFSEDGTVWTALPTDVKSGTIKAGALTSQTAVKESGTPFSGSLRLAIASVAAQTNGVQGVITVIGTSSKVFAS